MYRSYSSNAPSLGLEGPPVSLAPASLEGEASLGPDGAQAPPSPWRQGRGEEDGGFHGWSARRREQDGGPQGWSPRRRRGPRTGAAMALGSALAAEVTRGEAAMKPAVDEMFPEGAGPYVDLDEVRRALRGRWRGRSATARRRSAAAFAGRGKHGAADGSGRQRESGAC